MKRLAFKYCLVIFFLNGFWIVRSQNDFFKTYLQLDALNKRMEAKFQVKAGTTAKDSNDVIRIQRSRINFCRDSAAPLLNNVYNLTFPDINFINSENKDQTISDFSGQDLIINYTYLYCTGCVSRIDSTLRRIGSKPVKMLVLVSDVYVKEISDLQRYGSAIVTGLISPENIDLMSLKQGDDCMYYLNKDRQIEFFDKAEKKPREAWLSFLDQRFK